MADKNSDLYVSIKDLVVNDEHKTVFNEGHDDFYRDTHDLKGIMHISEFIKLILYFVNEGYSIDLNRYSYNIGKASIHVEDCEEYYGFHCFNDSIVNPCKKFIKDIVDETTYKIIQDANDIKIIESSLEYIKVRLESFIESQMSYDNVAKYNKILNAINDV